VEPHDADVLTDMEAVCARMGLVFVATPLDAIVGAADNVQGGAVPLNGLRHWPRTTSGWFLWAGRDLDPGPEFFKPTHARHLINRCPEVVKYLGLPPGSRFLVAPDHEDVWSDSTLLDDSV
jgi:hypothetical protein